MPEQISVKENIVAKAVKDETFRQELLANPKAVVAHELGVTLPAEVNVEVLEDTATTVHIVLPPNLPTNGMEELSDEELEGAAGGDYIILWTLYCQITVSK